VKEITMPEAKILKGSCHCGAVAWEATSDLAQTIACNCSRCSRLGWTISFVPAADFKLLSGADSLTDYRFNTRNIAHLFCTTCGVESFARGKGPDGGEMVCLNLRCVEGLDPDSLAPTKVDGRSR
jgi:hypothetical protein